MRGSPSDQPIVSPLGTLADGVVGAAGEHGTLVLDLAGIEIDWWIGADDAWHLPSEGAGRAVRPGRAPAVDARVRVPGGEVVLRGYACAGSPVPWVVADLENESPGPVVVAWVLRAAPGYRIGRVALDGTTLRIDDRALVTLPRAPLRWAVEPRARGVRERVLGGDAASGSFEPVAARRGDLEVAVLFPLAHRTRTRIAAATALPGATSVAVAQLPSADDVERGWDASLDQRGMRVELPEEALDRAVDAARVTLMLGGGRDRLVAAASGAWGLDEGRDRAADVREDPWPRLRATAEPAGATARGAAEWLLAVRDALLRVEDDDVVMLPSFPVEWLGQPVAVHDAPTALGPVSFALRWHGARPALLWDIPERLSLRAPALDAAWSGVGGNGEALLAEVDASRLLSLGSAAPVVSGAVVDEPGSFS
ncbi:MAG TPA: hypothetical protein VH914_02280 [Acidimicrobiia bacterium]|nr:hypothetical protein [Acidimicrobiia bacterium]